ncbi:RNAse P Rpr2/Rpp21/SNM1 subunit domain-containing protein [Roridomyces roridus]|uniref:RNAse P Rpr2/Rpp21/SNM1 subunit domain-containing protein n=1 Tax=Roridomyces roridus TaxID=1738132 RepID=A0AAD7CF28_9AGAR|nr:RNAse P Rpr2/Rpp21/SNM1 subunit domain-containing protein [Roridomyces roridus]
MAKKKDDAPNASNVVNKDIIQRLNFMYQASVYLGSVLPVPPPATTSPKRKKKARKMDVHDLSKSYVHSMKVVANKTMVKMDPAVKRTLCAGCNIVLVPGSTASVRVKSSKSHGHIMLYHCNSCNSTRRIPAPPTAAGPSTEMEVDVDESSEPSRKRKRGPTPRVPPLFARPEHIVLCGDARLPDRDPQLGDGIYIT